MILTPVDFPDISEYSIVYDHYVPPLCVSWTPPVRVIGRMWVGVPLHLFIVINTFFHYEIN